ncbi:hypothetical protein Catovirus_1_205 [Catovirus CTV1]|uniref:Uncharacterized protein n=1 Tax=Catovirus CTV1 TaxID=1977631 RepID=A0A1V0S8X1_9VIRU|nr:hypothetical protein Catovirus_1_205 [Catovirus CTV1]
MIVQYISNKIEADSIYLEESYEYFKGLFIGDSLTIDPIKGPRGTISVDSLKTIISGKYTYEGKIDPFRHIMEIYFLVNYFKVTRNINFEAIRYPFELLNFLGDFSRYMITGAMNETMAINNRVYKIYVDDDVYIRDWKYKERCKRNYEIYVNLENLSENSSEYKLIEWFCKNFGLNCEKNKTVATVYHKDIGYIPYGDDMVDVYEKETHEKKIDFIENFPFVKLDFGFYYYIAKNNIINKKKYRHIDFLYSCATVSETIRTSKKTLKLKQYDYNDEDVILRHYLCSINDIKKRNYVLPKEVNCNILTKEPFDIRMILDRFFYS